VRAPCILDRPRAVEGRRWPAYRRPRPGRRRPARAGRDRSRRQAADRISLSLCLRDADRCCSDHHLVHVPGRHAARRARPHWRGGEMSIANPPILSLVTSLPLVGALLVALLAGGNDEAGKRNARWIALWATLITFALSLPIWTHFDKAS